MTNPSTRRRVLFLDDEVKFLETAARAAAHYSKGRWEVFLADSASQALIIIQDQAIDLVVIDVQMPVVDGIQFLNLVHRKYPTLPKVVLTGFATEEYRTACLTSGAELFLEKPVQIEGFQAVLATLDGLMQFKPEEGFSGVLRKVGLPEIIQLECLSRHSTLLEIITPVARGTLYIQDGEVVHAQVGDQSGIEAFNLLITFNSGEFQFKPFVAPPTRTIHESHEFVLMEAVRLRDESALPAEGAPAAETEPPPASAPELASDLLPAQPVAAPPRANQTTARDLREILVCTAQAEVLYEWQCRHSETRVSFMEFVSGKSRQMAQVLGLGAFERLELEDDPGEANRAVVLIRPEWAAFVRTQAIQDIAQPASS